MIVEKLRDSLVAVCFERRVNTYTYHCQVFEEGIIALNDVPRSEAARARCIPLANIRADLKVVRVKWMAPDELIEPTLRQVIPKLLFSCVVA